MHATILFISTATLAILIIVLLIDRKLSGADVFSPVSIFVYFSLVSTFSLIWFAISQSAIYELTYPQVAPRYRNDDLVILAYVFNTISILAIYFGMFLGYYVKHRKLNYVFGRFFGFNSLSEAASTKTIETRKKSEYLGLFFVALGMFFYVYFIFKLGGIVELWLNLHQRVDRAAGLGYIYYAYSFLLVFGSLLYLASALKYKKIKSLFLIILISLALVSLGQRGPVIAYLFSIAIVYSYHVKRIRNIISIRSGVFFILFISFTLAIVQFRTPGNLEKYRNNPGALITESALSFEKNFIDRINSLERSIVVIGYFNENDSWKGASYLGLLLAPVPRGYLSDKPPVDTGRYLLSMAQGNTVNPPEPLENLPSSSWPEGNWAGYMNFKIPGFFLANFLSGFIFGWIGQLPRATGYKLLPIIFYAMIAWGGGISLSPYGIVNILMAFVLFFIASFFIRLRLCSSRKTSPITTTKLT